jgi:transcriptional regulator with XRE-family HTH domain
MAVLHHAHMQRTCLREWRKFNGFTLEQVAQEARMSHSQLSRIERGVQPYDQHLLEFLAKMYGCDVADLIVRPPGQKFGVQQAFDSIPLDRREQAIAVLEALAKTGTDG